MKPDQPQSEERHSEVLGALPRSRPHRRSSKRTASAPAAEAAPSVAGPTAAEAGPSAAEAAPSARTARRTAAGRGTTAGPVRPAARVPKPPREKPLRQPPQPRGAPPKPPRERTGPAPVQEPSAETAHGVLSTTVQAAAELAEIGLSASARALRRAVSRLPRP